MTKVKARTADEKAAIVRIAAGQLRDDVSSTPLERQIMRDLRQLEDSSLVILYDAFRSYDV